MPSKRKAVKQPARPAPRAQGKGTSAQVRKKGPSAAKAKKILKHGSVHGKKLTRKAKRFMGARAGGARRKS